MKINLLIILIFLKVSSLLYGQQHSLRNIGVAYTVETNIGFHGITFTYEKEIKLKNKLGAVIGGNFFTSDRIPDRKVGFNQYNRSFIADACLQYNPQGLSKGFFVNFGPSLRYTKLRHTFSYYVNAAGEPFDIKYTVAQNMALGFKIGLGYKLPITKKLNTTVFFDCRFIDNIPEPTFLGLGTKIGF